MSLRLAVLALLTACGASGNVGVPDAATADPDGDAPPIDAPTIVNASSFIDKVFIGYQGWFAAAGDGSPVGAWYHWGSGMPRPGNVTFELYPDVRDYPAAALFEAGLGHLGNGGPAKLFGSWSDVVIDTHFRWLADNGLDGIALQRFVVALYDPNHLRQRNDIAAKVRAAAEAHGRVFYLEYDISGAHSATWVDDIEHDFSDVIRGQLDLLSSPQYAHQGGKPVVCVWGFGFPDRPGEGAESLALIQWLQGQGLYVVGGVPYNWRSGANTKPGFATAFAALDMVQPWAVGTVSSDADVDAHFADIVAHDKALTDSRGQAYQRVVFPGFAWSNWNGGARNMIPRRAGRLFWRQAYQATLSHISTFVAMFDEYDEGTAIGRAAENATQIPVDQYFLTLDADGEPVSSDFYLRLAGAATRMLEGQAPVQATIPITPGATTGEPLPVQMAVPDHLVRTFTDPQAAVVVSRLYRAILGRDADSGGLATYAPVVAQGHLPVVVSALVTSAEFDARRGSLSIDAFVEDLYQRLLDRASDPTGNATTHAQVVAGTAGARIVDMLISAEYAAAN